jgi:hypothetical protein
MTGTASSRDAVVRLNLDVGSFELGVGECRELMRSLERRGELPDGAGALAFRRRLASLLESGETTLPGGVGEDDLDAVADAAWAWLERDGLDGFPERVLLLLDVARARHAHD